MSYELDELKREVASKWTQKAENYSLEVLISEIYDLNEKLKELSNDLAWAKERILKLEQKEIDREDLTTYS